MEGDSEIEIRQVFEASDFGEAMTPEMKEAEEPLAAQMKANANRWPGRLPRPINRGSGGGVSMRARHRENSMLQFKFFQDRQEYGVLFLRLLIGLFIIHGVADNVFSWVRMVEFEKFLAARSVPYPLLAAHLSAYAQFICGLSILFGAFVRPTSIVFMINFIAAIVIAHLGQTFQQMFPALMMVAAKLFFLFNGAGPLSVDARLQRRKLPK